MAQTVEHLPTMRETQVQSLSWEDLLEKEMATHSSILTWERKYGQRKDPGRLQSMGFPRQEYWSGLPFPFPGDLPDPGIEPTSPTLQANPLPLSHQEVPPERAEYANTPDRTRPWAPHEGSAEHCNSDMRQADLNVHATDLL